MVSVIQTGNGSKVDDYLASPDELRMFQKREEEEVFLSLELFWPHISSKTVNLQKRETIILYKSEAFIPKKQTKIK